MKIALTGKMRSGKDTVAYYLYCKYGFKKFAFGNGIKMLCQIFFSPLMKREGKQRQLLQNIGQYMRSIDPNVWIRRMNLEIERYTTSEDYIIVTDLRQMNEYDYLKQNGYIIIKVHADDEIRKQRIIAAGDIFNEEDFYHETELAVDNIPYDYLITNNTSLDDLEKQVDEILGRCFSGRSKDRQEQERKTIAGVIPD